MEKRIRFAGLLLGMLGVTLLVYGHVLAAPAPTDDCTTRCQEKNHFAGFPNPDTICTTFDDSICDLCTSGRCKDFVGPNLPSCLKTGVTKLRIFADNSCTPKCDLPLKQSAESNQGGPPLRNTFDVDRLTCQR